MKNKISLISIIAVILVIALTVLGLTKGIARAENVQKTAKKVTRPVPVVRVESCRNIQCREFPGVVRAAKRVEMGFNLGGIITELQAREGKEVRKGEVLARLDDRDCKNALASAEAVLKEATQKYYTAEKLRKKKIISKSDFDKSLATWEIAKAKVGVCIKNLADTVLLAPFDGIIAARYAEKFERTSAGQDVLSIQDVSTIEVVIQVPESMIAGGGVKSFARTSFRLTADQDGKYYDCRVTEFRCMPDKSTKTYNVVLALDIPENCYVLPGMSADVRVEFCSKYEVAEDKGLSRVPLGALWRDDAGKTKVWIIPENDGRPVAITVEVEDIAKDFARVSGEVKPGQYVAVAGVNTLGADMVVCPQKASVKGLEG